MSMDTLRFTYEAMKRNPGDRIRAADWNRAMQAIASLGELGASQPLERLEVVTPAQPGTGAISGTNTFEHDMISGLQGSPVYGDGTAFLAQLRVGDRITAGGQTRVVVRVDSDTKLYVDSAFYPPVQSGFTFARPLLLVKDGHVGIGAPDPQGQLEVSIPGQVETRPLLVVKDGNVGVGTSAPQGLLDISTVNTGTGAITGVNTWDMESTGFGGSPVSGSGTAFLTQLRAGDRITANRQTRTVTRIDSDTKLYVDAPFGFAFPSPTAFTFTRPALLVKDGRVGIGVTNATETLEVAGAIKAARFIGDGSGLSGVQGASGSQWVDKGDGSGIYYSAGSVTIGAANKGATLQILNRNQDATGDTLLLGRGDGPHVRLGYHADYGWVQTGSGRPLAINPLGGNVGIGTNDPGTYKLKVQRGDTYLDGALAVTGAASLQGAVTVGSPMTPQNLNVNGSVFVSDTAAPQWQARLEVAMPAADNSSKALVIGKGGANYLTILNNGNVGIGAPGPGAKLHIKQPRAGANNGLVLEETDANGNATGRWLNIYYEGQGTVVFYHQNGQGQYMPQNGNWHVNSDRSLKENIIPLQGILEKVMRLAPVRFQWRSSQMESLGFIAQDVEQIFPELVHAVSLADQPVKGLPYPLFGVLAIAALQELAASIQQRIEELASTVTALANTR